MVLARAVLVLVRALVVRALAPPKHQLVELQSQSWPPVSIGSWPASATQVPDTRIQSTNSCACRERAGTRVLCMKLARTEIVEPTVLLLALLAHAHVAGVVLHAKIQSRRLELDATQPHSSWTLLRVHVDR